MFGVLTGFTARNVAGRGFGIARNDDLAVFLSTRLAKKGLNTMKITMTKALMPEKKFLLRAGEVEVSGFKNGGKRWPIGDVVSRGERKEALKK